MLPLNPLKRYRFKGYKPNGEPVTGELWASSLALAKHLLSQQALVVQAVDLDYVSMLSMAVACWRLQPKTVMRVLTQQLLRLLQSGLPLLKAIELLLTMQSNPVIRFSLQTIQTQLASGLNLSDALKRHPQICDPLSYHLIAAGEQVGQLEATLNRLWHYLETEAAFKQQVKQALFYPAIVFCLGFCIGGFLLFGVIPQFKTLFADLNAPLPVFTLWVLLIADQVSTHALFSCLLCIVVAWIMQQSFNRFVTFKWWVLSRLPVLGGLYKQVLVIQLTQTLSMILKAGLPLFDALKLTEQATPHPIYAQEIQRIREKVACGERMQSTLNQSGLFPQLMIQLVTIGEESGTLGDLLASFATQEEQALTGNLKTLTTLIEPVLITLLGLWIGGLVFAMYLPIFQMSRLI